MLSTPLSCHRRASNAIEFETGLSWMIHTENSLLSRIGNGDKAAVSEFVDRYGGLLWSMALRSTRNEADAEDAVQDVFVELWNAAEKFNAELSSEKTFVCMVARRRLIDRSRKKKLAYEVEEIDAMVGEFKDASTSAELHDEVEKAVAILDALPAQQSKAIRLSIFGGMSHSQIADATGASLGTVKTHIRRGLIAMRQKIGIPAADPEGGLI